MTSCNLPDPDIFAFDSDVIRPVIGVQKFLAEVITMKNAPTPDLGRICIANLSK